MKMNQGNDMNLQPFDYEEAIRSKVSALTGEGE